MLAEMGVQGARHTLDSASAPHPTRPVLWVTRCDEARKSSDAGESWCIEPAKAIEQKPVQNLRTIATRFGLSNISHLSRANFYCKSLLAPNRYGRDPQWQLYVDSGRPVCANSGPPPTA